MRAAPFRHVRVDDVEHAVEVLAEHGDDAKILAGGQSLIPLMSLRFARPAVLVDIGRVEELRHVDVAGDRATIGTRTTHHDIERGLVGSVLRERAPVFGAAARQIGHLPIRTRGTFGGSISHADPLAEWCLLARLLDATVLARSSSGDRYVEAAAFFEGPLSTSLRPDELVVSIEIDVTRQAALTEFARRQGDFAVVSAAATVSLDAQGRLAATRIALGGVASVPIRCPGAEAIATGAVPSDELLDEVEHAVASEITPPDDVLGSREYRRHLAGVLVRDALSRAWAA